MYKVLIVEDEALLRKALRKMVERMEDYQVVGELSDGDDVLSFCERDRPDFVCVDADLPGADGVRVAGKVKECCAGAGVFLLARYGDFRVLREALEAGVDACLFKPWREEEVRRTFFKYQGLAVQREGEGDALTESIRKKDINDTFLLCRKLAADIFSLHYKEQDRYAEISRITAYSVDYMKTLATGQQEAFEKKYALVADIQKSPCIAEAFFHFLMKDVYRLQLLSKYPQFSVVLSYIDSNVDKSITLNDVSDICAMSVGYITRIFKRYYGVGVVDYAHLIKILWAKLYLACTELSISDISYDLGYNDPGYFSKVFKKYEGMTPTLYKQSYCCQGYNIKGNFKHML